jgi:hypothetical protein
MTSVNNHVTEEYMELNDYDKREYPAKREKKKILILKSF